MSAATALDEVGATIAGRYRVEQVIGRGGMGAVYRVCDTDGRALALKRGWARDAKKAAHRQALLQREYCTLSQLRHPYIIEVFDYGIDEQGPYYTMELLDGQDLEATGRMPWREACSVLRDIASSLSILHSRRLLHRDLSARNVRRTHDGRAKLIDFGTLAAMDGAKDVTGTPPFVAPEVLQMQALDARADLYSLGALAYYLLTGRHAYPSRRFSELRDAWRSAPIAPGRIVDELPAALSSLVMQLLALDRGARPHSAVEVMTRLCAIAGLPAEESADVSRSYLTTPALVAREKALIEVRKTVMMLGRADGGTLLFEGPSGSGRSRMLDACALEAKLLGAVVVRADAGDAMSGDYGVVRALGAQLLELMPSRAAESARLSSDVLGHVLEDLRLSLPATSSTPPERGLLIRELRDFVLSLCRSQPLVLIIDDADSIDEPSAALVAALAEKSERHPLILAVSVDSDTRRSPSLAQRVLRSIARPIELQPLGAEQTEALLRSTFGDVPNVALIAGRIHAVAQGIPRTIMDLAQHLIDRGLARCEAGLWKLPAELDDTQLPDSLAAAFSARLSRLGTDERELVELLCLADADAISLMTYQELVSHRDQRRVFIALDGLVSARVLQSSGDRYVFCQRGLIGVCEKAIPAQRKREIHGRLADLLARTGGDVLRRAHHLFPAARPLEAIELLCSIDLPSRLADLSMLELAIAEAQRLALPARVVHQLRMALLTKAPLDVAGSARAWKEHLGPELERLDAESGLRRYRELAAQGTPGAMAQALAETHQRYLETHESERVCAPAVAIRELARLQTSCSSMAVGTWDMAMLEALPSLDPLVPLSPSLGVTQLGLAAAKQWIGGSNHRGRRLYEQLLARLSDPDRVGLDEAQITRRRMSIHFVLGLYHASLGSTEAENHARVLEVDRELRISAWRVRQLMHLYQGDVDEAARCLRRGELLQLQDGLGERYLGANAGFELVAYSTADDLLGVKSALPPLHEVAKRIPGWVPVYLYGCARALELEGDLLGALEPVRAGLELAEAGRHVYFGQLAATHVDVLSGLGRHDEACRFAEQYLAQCECASLFGRSHGLYLAAALAFARSGDTERGKSLLQGAIEAAEEQGQRGLSLGLVFEARARLALCCDRLDEFEQYASHCAAELDRSYNPALSRKLARLLDEGRAHGQVAVDHIPRGDAAPGSSESYSDFATIHSRMRECVDESERARYALTTLLQNVESFAGYLYAVNEHGLALLAGLPDGMPSRELDVWARARVRADLDADAYVTNDLGDSEDDLPASHTDAFGRTFEVLLLATRASGEHRVAAALVLHVAPGPRIPAARRLVSHIAAELMQHGDASGVRVDYSAPPSTL